MKRWKILGILCLILFFGCVGLLGTLFLSDGGNVQQFRKKVDRTDSTIKNPVDWKKLQKVNPNIYAWLYIPGTNIDYPVLQAGKEQKEDFYLKHNYKDQYEFAGSIYSQKENSKDFQDPVTILYGHNMINGSMFAGIRNYENADFFQEHGVLYIYMPDRILTYQIVSYYVTDNKNLLEAYHPDTEEGFKKYQTEIISRGDVRKEVKLTAEDHILTLSTCSSTENNRRVLQNVLMDVNITTK